MTIPNKEEFLQWKFLANANANLELADRYTTEAMAAGVVTDDLLKRFIDEAWTNRDEHGVKLWDHPVTCWLTEDRSYIRANELMFRRLNSIGDDVATKARRVERLRRKIDSPRKLFWLREEALWWTPAHYWPNQIISLIFGYLYLDIDAIYAARRSAQGKLRKIRELIGEVREGLGSYAPDSHYEAIERQLFWLDDIAAGVPKRDQKNKRETAFVKGVAALNMSYGNRKPKPQVIAELMTMEVFERQLDVRTLARICAGMTKKRGVG
ncbi:hypothetical protein [Pseudacidovorax intermedius]|uniref:hypothetical protein n=1 Tax=Pseudacidovorax intermedius TaxID=433924 RepID=UPI0026EA0CDE|nr:hypothetical protein [Pseudacidovorax intermedius]